MSSPLLDTLASQSKVMPASEVSKALTLRPSSKHLTISAAVIKGLAESWIATSWAELLMACIRRVRRFPANFV